MNDDEMPCPVCAETIKRNATVCRFCGAKASNIGGWRKSGQQLNSFQSCLGCGGIALVGLFILMSLGDFGGSPEEPVEDASITENAVETVSATGVTIRALYDAYAENEVAAQQQWGDRLLAITGTVQSVDLDITDDPVVTLEDGGKTINTYFDMDAGGAATGELKKGQRVTLACSSLSERLGVPFLSDCKVSTDVHEVEED